MNLQEKYFHTYISTACTHALHRKCRLECKWCGNRCICTCHQIEDTAEEHPDHD